MLIAQRPTLSEEVVSDNRSRFVIEPLEPGFGYTLGNSLRRTLLSSIPGAAVTSIKIDGNLHEFSTIEGVVEDVTEIILNLKGLVVSSEEDEPVTMYLRKAGPGAVTAADIAPPAGVEVHNSDLHIATLNENGKLVTVTMGSYGIGVSRAVAALTEQTADDKGLCWPREIAPADVHVVAAGKALQTELALDVSEKLNAAGLRVLVDDRPGISPGVKFTDSELIGVPQILVAGRRSAEGVLELKDRRTGEREELTVDEAIARLTARS